MGVNKKKIKNQWFLGLKKFTGELDLSGLLYIYPPIGRYYADPFLHQDGDDLYVFFEDYDYRKGVISYLKFNKELVPYNNVPIKVLEESYHLSYPYLYEENGELYMIPETGECGEIRLYKCIQFPNKWKFVKTLISSIIASDVQLHKDGSDIYLFTTIHPDMDVELVIFKFNNSILSKGNILNVFKINNSRPAGNIFELNDGIIIRPTQQNGQFYGHEILLKEFNINNLKYTDKIIGKIEANWHPDIFGNHTINFNDNYIVVDGKRKIEL